MATIEYEYEASVCMDCMHLSHNGEPLEDRDERAPMPLSLMSPGEVMGMPGIDDHPYFSWASCDTCGTTLGGDRYDVTVVKFA